MNTKEDYDNIGNLLASFVENWQSHEDEHLDDLFYQDVKCCISTSFEEDSCLNGLYHLKRFVKETPEHDRHEYQIGNRIIRVSGTDGYSVCETAIKAYFHGECFDYIAEIACRYRKQGSWKISEIRIDIQDFDSPLRDVFAKSWYFSKKLAILEPGVHMPCIMPELDNPYYQIPECGYEKSEEEKIEECFAKYNFGKDNLLYIWVKETLSDRFENDDKKHFIAYNKFVTQRYRYNFSSCRPLSITVDNDEAIGMFSELVPVRKNKEVRFIKEDGKWTILNIQGGK